MGRLNPWGFPSASVLSCMSTFRSIPHKSESWMIKKRQLFACVDFYRVLCRSSTLSQFEITLKEEFILAMQLVHHCWFNSRKMDPVCFSWVKGGRHIFYASRLRVHGITLVNVTSSNSLRLARSTLKPFLRNGGVSLVDMNSSFEGSSIKLLTRFLPVKSANITTPKELWCIIICYKKSMERVRYQITVPVIVSEVC